MVEMILCSQDGHLSYMQLRAAGKRHSRKAIHVAMSNAYPATGMVMFVLARHQVDTTTHIDGSAEWDTSGAEKRPLRVDGEAPILHLDPHFRCVGIGEWMLHGAAA
ncbi:hypothetical protein BST61_g2712 [Cercospora zeina]